MKKIERVYNKILQDIKDGALGKSGNKFLTVRELADKYGVSFVSATKILNELIKTPYLIQVGSIAYVLNGIANKDCDLFKKVPQNSNIIGFHAFSLNNSFASQIIDEFVDLADKNGYEVVVTSGKDIKHFIKRFILMGCKAIITFEINKVDDVDALSAAPIPSVIIGNTFKNAFSHYVTTNNLLAGEMIAKHLHECNYSKFCYVGTNPEQESRLTGFKGKLINLGVNESDISVAVAPNTVDRIPVELTNLIKSASIKERLGIFCFHDVIALSVYNEIRKYKKLIPDEIGVVGFDNLSISNILTPQLTSVYYNFNELVGSALNIVLSSIDNPRLPTVKKVTVPSLIIKDSTKKIN